MRRLESRLAKLEQRRHSDRRHLDNPNRPRTFAEIMAAAGAPLPPGVTFAHILAAAEGSEPPDDDDAWGRNVVNVDSELFKLTGDVDAWRENERKIKRWSPEWERENWPNAKQGE